MEVAQLTARRDFATSVIGEAYAVLDQLNTARSPESKDTKRLYDSVVIWHRMFGELNRAHQQLEDLMEQDYSIVSPSTVERNYLEFGKRMRDEAISWTTAISAARLAADADDLSALQRTSKSLALVTEVHRAADVMANSQMRYYAHVLKAPMA